MPKKKETEIKNILNKYIQEFLSFLLASLEEGTEDLLKKFKNLINFKKRLQKYVIYIIIVIASLTIILYGLGSFLVSFFPTWKPGVSHMLVGTVFILIAWIYKKYG